jgi:L-methionine (R)-S-oxide reductase
MDDSRLVEQLRKILGESLDRAANAGRVAQAIRNQGRYRWVGVYEVDI